MLQVVALLIPRKSVLLPRLISTCFGFKNWFTTSLNCGWLVHTCWCVSTTLLHLENFYDNLWNIKCLSCLVEFSMVERHFSSFHRRRNRRGKYEMGNSNLQDPETHFKTGAFQTCDFFTCVSGSYLVEVSKLSLSTQPSYWTSWESSVTGNQSRVLMLCNRSE